MKTIGKFAALGLGALGVMVSAAAASDMSDLPDAPGKDVTLAVCTQCHGIDLFAQPRPAEEWSQVITFMIGNGMSVSDEEYGTILDYLTTNMVPDAQGPVAAAE
tara:strand:- start:384 stop:695 length:312 start_codon:yes stop_codon:yes gene_type:complete